MTLFPDETADALYAGVMAHPGDDLRRLILADRMEEIGMAEWAEFVRIGCELGRIDSFVHCSLPGSRLGDGCNNSECPRCGPERESWVRLLNLFRSNFKAWFPEAVATDCYDMGFGMAGHDAEEGVRVRRGFPAEVRAPMAWLLGGECVCVQRWELHRVPPGETIVGGCYACSGTGRTPGHLSGLVRTWPIERVVVTDKEPYPNGSGQVWYDQERSRPRSSLVPVTAELPTEVFDRLTGHIDGHGGGRWKAYPTAPRSLTALSDTILKLAKEEP